MPAAVTLSTHLEVRCTLVVGTDDGIPRGVDLRLYRRQNAGEVAYPTGAGFRIPIGAVRALARALIELADQAGMP